MGEGEDEMKQSFDYLIVGGGLWLDGCARVAQALPGSEYCSAGKEAALGKHASGRNSGVLHSGIYYDSST